MQIDVNGMHTAGMVSAYERGVRNLFIGPNSYYGAPPVPTPAAFHWQIDKDKKMFVWLNSSYNNGTFMFNKNWRQGPVPNYSDLRYRAPEEGDIWASDDALIMEAHRLCLESVALIEGSAKCNGAAETDGFTKNRVFGGYTMNFAGIRDQPVASGLTGGQTAMLLLLLRCPITGRPNVY